MLHDRLRRRPDDPTAPVDASTGPWTVHRAGLVDVNPIARLLADHRPFIDLDGDGEPDHVADPENAGPATRLVLSHGALEHGEVWFARDDAGVAAVAVWMPPDADPVAADLHRVVARELGVDATPPQDPAHAPLRSIVGATARTAQVAHDAQVQRVLILLADAGRAGVTDGAGGRGAPGDGTGGRTALLADVLAPVAAREAGEGRDVLAVTVDPAQVADLETLGFGRVGAAPLGAATLWLGSLRAGRTEPVAVA